MPETLNHIGYLLGCLAFLTASSSWGAVTFKVLNSFGNAVGAQPYGQLLRATNGLFYGTTASGGENGLGAIYSATTSGALNRVASFDGANGAQPLAGLVQGPDGNFYGTASSGGAYGKGTIFRATPDGTLTNLFSFDGTNGARPLAPLIIGADNNLYGTASAGGAFDLGTIFRFDLLGGVSNLFSFAGTSGAQPAGALVQVADGTLYGTAPAGGFYGNGTVYSLTPVGLVFTNVYSFAGGTNGAGPQAGLILGSDGKLYGTTATGGTNTTTSQGAGTVFVISPNFFSRRHAFIGTDGASPLGALAEANGVLYGTTRAGGTHNDGTIFSMRFNGSFTNLISFAGGNGSGPSSGLTPGTNGNFFGVATGGGKNGLGTFYELSGFSPFIITAPTNAITVVSGDTVVLRVLAGGSAPLSYQWQFNSNNVVNGKNITGAASPTLTISNITPAQAGTYFVTVRNSASEVASARAQVSVLPRPLISITSPQRGARIHSSSLRVTGTTGGEATVARVYSRLNDGDWQLAATSDNWLHWRADVTMPSGTNRVDAFAESVLGTFSKTNSVSFTCAVTSAPVVVQINGAGIVNPNLNGEYLQVGKSYAITAIPATGSVFGGWRMGDVETNAARVVFVMESNLVLQANFQPDLFFTGKGSYNGLFQATDADVSPTNSGLFALTLTGRGAFTGHVQLGQTRTAFAGHFDMDGSAEVTVPRRNLNTLTNRLHLISDENTNAISGTVSDGVWSAELNAYRAVFNANTNPAPLAGRYTLRIRGEPGSTDVPGGDSYGTLLINTAGVIRFSGSLSDNTKISQSIPISEDGYWPLYVPLYGNQGLMAGWLTFSSVNSATGSITGNVNWIKPEVPTAKYYPEGFRVSSDVIGSSYVVPTNGVPILELGANAAIMFMGGDLTNGIINSVELDAQNRIVNSDENPMNLIFTLSNGLFHGNVTDPDTAEQFPFRGVVLQNGDSAAGYFLGPTQSGEVLLEAR